MAKDSASNIRSSDESNQTRTALIEMQIPVRNALKALRDLEVIGFPEDIAIELKDLQVSIANLSYITENIEDYYSRKAKFKPARTGLLGASLRVLGVTFPPLAVFSTAILDTIFLKNNPEEIVVNDVVKKTKTLENKIKTYPRFENREFSCISDNARCMDKFAGRSKIYKGMCAIAFATCIARSLMPFLGKPK